MADDHNPARIISTERLDLVSMSPAFIEAALADNLAEAGRIGGFDASGWRSDRQANFLRRRAKQMRDDLSIEQWLARAIVLRDAPGRPMIGHMGFHGPPENGSLDMGYSVFEPFRRQGIALEAALAMIAWACAEHGIRRFILSISPNNGQSLALAEKMGFHRIGEQMDEEDGLEYVFERVLDSDD